MRFDYLIVGAGISGVAAGYELARHGKVAIVEAESHAGYHSSGRSAALYTPNYGPDLVRKISQLSSAFLSQPPIGFTEQAILSPRGMLMIMPAGEEQAGDVSVEASDEHFAELTQKQTLNMVPFLRSENVSGAIYESGVLDMDADLLHQSFLLGFKQRGGTLLTNFKVESIVRKSDCWEVASNSAQHSGRVIINAAGAWADEVGALANAAPIDLQPKRRTAMLIDMPPGVDHRQVPAMVFYGTENYIKPQAGQLMVSPGDETPVVAQDIQPDEMDIAVLVDWLERETRIEVARVQHTWAGLRNFVPDGTPVVGYDAHVEDFFWLAGQGGYGIMMSASLARASESLLINNCLPEDFVVAGINKQQLSPQRINSDE